MKKIKLIFVNSDTIETKINGTEKEIINHYNDINFFNSCSNEKEIKNKQIKEIEIEANPVDLLGCIASTIVYPFKYDNKAQCYLY